MATNITSANFDEKVLNSDTPVLLDFWAEWCGPCKAIGPFIEELATEFEGKAGVYKVNVDQEGELAMRYNVMSIPALVVFKGGQMVEFETGSRPKAAIAELINRHL